MALNFRNAGHHVIVATEKGEPTQADCTNDGIEVKRFDIKGSPAIGVGFHGDTSLYQDWIVQESPDLIICHCWNTWSSALLLPLLNQIPSRSILVSHGYSDHLIDPTILPRGLWRWLRWLPTVCSLPSNLRRFDFVVFLSTQIDYNRYFDAKIARMIGCRNTRVIPNGIDTTDWKRITPIASNFRKNYNLSGKLIFLCVANYFPNKNQMMALEAFSRANIPGSVLVFIGSTLGQYGNEVLRVWTEKKKQHPMIDVIFLQNIERDQVVAAIMSSDVALLSSKTEAQPITILEAMACGKPFICTKVGCVSELKGGIIISDVASMAEAMRQLAESPHERQRLGADGKKDFESNYSIAVTTKKWEELLGELFPPD